MKMNWFFIVFFPTCIYGIMWKGWQLELKELISNRAKLITRLPHPHKSGQNNKGKEDDVVLVFGNILTECFASSFPYDKEKKLSILQGIRGLSNVDYKSLLIDPTNVKIKVAVTNPTKNVKIKVAEPNYKDVIFSGFTKLLFWPHSVARGPNEPEEKIIKRWTEEANKLNLWIKENCKPKSEDERDKKEEGEQESQGKNGETKESGHQHHQQQQPMSIFGHLTHKFWSTFGDEPAYPEAGTLSKLFEIYTGEVYHYQQNHKGRHNGKKEEVKEEEMPIKMMEPQEEKKMEQKFHELLKNCICEKTINGGGSDVADAGWYDD